MFTAKIPTLFTSVCRHAYVWIVSSNCICFYELNLLPHYVKNNKNARLRVPFRLALIWSRVKWFIVPPEVLSTFIRGLNKHFPFRCGAIVLHVSEYPPPLKSFRSISVWRTWIKNGGKSKSEGKNAIKPYCYLLRYDFGATLIKKTPWCIAWVNILSNVLHLEPDYWSKLIYACYSYFVSDTWQAPAKEGKQHLQ